MANILIIDDDTRICDVLSKKLVRAGHTVFSAENLTQGLATLHEGGIDVVFLDIQLPDGSGLDILSQIKEVEFPPEVIVMTAFADPESISLAMSNGAWNYLQKPFLQPEMLLAISQALEYREQNQGRQLPAFNREKVIGTSKKLTQCLEKSALVAQSDVTVLVVGETGTGKELISQTIHENSIRSKAAFVTVDCTALQETLVESALFGHKKGSFTGAVADNDGFIRQAHGGTLFLDEIGDLSPVLQKKFLRVLQSKCYRPLGSNQDQESDFRLIAATHRNLDEMAQTGAFREDLLFRLKSFIIDLPPLRDRKDDIRDLVEHYLQEFSTRYRQPPKTGSADFMDSLTSYDWPGNIRELKNALNRALAAAHTEPVLFACHLPLEMRIRLIQNTLPSPDGLPSNFPEKLKNMPKIKALRDATIARLEADYFQHLAVMTEGDIQQISALSGLGRAQVYRMLQKYDISLNGSKPESR